MLAASAASLTLAACDGTASKPRTTKAVDRLGLRRTVAELGDLVSGTTIGLAGDLIAVDAPMGVRVFRCNDGSTAWTRAVDDRSGLPRETEIHTITTVGNRTGQAQLLGTTWSSSCFRTDEYCADLLQTPSPAAGVVALPMKTGGVSWVGRVLDPVPVGHANHGISSVAIVKVLGSTRSTVVAMITSEERPEVIQALVGLDPRTGSRKWSAPGLFGVRVTDNHVLAVKGVADGAVRRDDLFVLDGNTGRRVEIPALASPTQYGLWLPQSTGDRVAVLASNGTQQQRWVIDLASRKVMHRFRDPVVLGRRKDDATLIALQGKEIQTIADGERTPTAARGTAGLRPRFVQDGVLWCLRGSGRSASTVPLDRDGHHLTDPVPGTILHVNRDWAVLDERPSGKGLSIYRITH